MKAAGEVLKVLRREHKILIEEDLAKVLGEKGSALDEMSIDILVTVGGDGTILRALQLGDFEILGVNISRVGFLTEVGIDSLEDVLQDLTEGKFVIDERIKLRVDSNGKRQPDCVNEAVIHTASLAKVRRFRVTADGEVVATVEGDGVIVATPTGSTAYSMSAGGPILDPRVRAFVITALAPFRQTLRPTVVPADGRIVVELLDRGPCVLVLDGQQETKLPSKARVEFTISEKRARFVRFTKAFYTRVNEKLTEGLHS